MREQIIEVLSDDFGRVSSARKIGGGGGGDFDPSGTYNDLTAGHAKEAEEAGLAKQLKSTVGVTDGAVYGFRSSGGSLDVSGRMELRKLRGLTLGWNQLAKSVNSTNWVVGVSGVTLTFSGGVATATAAAKGALMKAADGNLMTIPGGHKVLISARVKLTTATDKVCLYANAQTGKKAYTGATTAWQTLQKLQTWDGSSGASYKLVQFRDERESGWDAVKIKEVQVIDLTECFGAAIADSLAALESGTPGAGVAWFKRYFPKDCYAYDAGSLQSAQLKARRAVGFNAYDHTAGTARVVGGLSYQITGAYTALSLGGETLTPDADGKFTPAVSGVLTVTGGDAATTCVHLAWDGERDGEYEAYDAQDYALDDTLELRGLPGKDANGSLTCDGDEYAPDGTVTRKYLQIDMGDLVWRYDAGGYFVAEFDTYSEAFAVDTPGALKASGYETVALNTLLNEENTGDLQIAGEDDGSMVYVMNSAYSDAAAFAAAMSGKKLLYKLATATTESADAYTKEQAVDNWGAEELVDAAVTAPSPTRDVSIPAGHESWYPCDLRAKLETLPSVPAGDGDYVLKCTVSGGEAACAWVSEA